MVQEEKDIEDYADDDGDDDDHELTTQGWHKKKKKGWCGGGQLKTAHQPTGGATLSQ